MSELNILVSQCPNLHILAFTETWLNNNIADGEVSLLGYSIHRGDRADGLGGGIAVYVRDTLSVIRRSDLEIDFSGECMWLEILLPKAKGILFGTFYRPPSQSDFLDSFQEVLDCASAKNKEMLTTGDFNFDLLDTSRPKSIRDLKGIFSSFNLAQLIDRATRITKDSATLLDLFATNFPRTITLAKVIPSTLSDHDMLLVVRKINANKLPPHTIECRNFSSYDQQVFCEDLNNCCWNDVLNEEDVNSAWLKWKELFLLVCNKHAPVRRKIMRGAKCPWLQVATKKLMNERDSVLRKARRTGSEVDWSRYRRLRNQVSNRIKFEKRRYQRSEISDNMDNPKSFWKIMKNIFPGKKEKITSPQSIKTDDGETVIDLPTIAQRFNEFFTGAVSRLLKTAGPPMNGGQFSSKKITSERFILQPISEKFILKQLRDLKVKKATGLDGIPARFLKDSATVIAPTVTFLVNLSLSTGSVPDEWKKARVVPLYKSGGRENMDNYRPISILPVLSKILEKAVNFQLQQYLKKFDLLSPAQSGFRQHHSTESAVIYFTDEIRRNADAGRLTGALFVDLKKAFDTVPHKELISKLERFGFVDNSIAWFTNYLSNRSQVVSLGNNLSSPLAVENGVPQGSILGPVLFSLYINDLPSCINFSNVIMYADDTVIFFSSAQLMEVELKLNMELTSLSQWLCGNKLLLNLKITEFMVFGTQQRLHRQGIEGIDIALGGESVKHCDAFKYLGVILDSSLSLNQHIDYVKKKVSKMLGIFSRARPSLTIESANRLFKSMILPILDYCGAVFHRCGKGNEEGLECLQRRGGRIALPICPPNRW